MSVARSRWVRACWISAFAVLGTLSVAACNQVGDADPEDVDETEQELGSGADSDDAPGDVSWVERSAGVAVDGSEGRVGPSIIDLQRAPIPEVPWLPLSEPDPLPWRRPGEGTRDDSDSSGDRSPSSPTPS